MHHEHLDVVIIGAGLSGIGAAYRLKNDCRDLTFTILERRERVGGTWDLFCYPGVRCDSDMATLGFLFKPWDRSKSIAGGAEIQEYVERTARETGVAQNIRFGHKVLSAEWSTERAIWEVQAIDESTAERTNFTCSFLISCAGYYDYDEGYAPEFPGEESFSGQVIHPQHWPEGFDYSGKRVIVIGSGATAVTIVPAMADTAASVTMLQRSPTYMASRPGTLPFAIKARQRLPELAAARAIRWRNVLMAAYTYQVARRQPEKMKAKLRRGIEAQLPAGYDVETHFVPSYEPWDQRLCLVPDGDMFRAISQGRAAVVTDQIERFTETGIQLRSGEHLDADVIVTATGLNLQAMGGITLAVDGTAIDVPNTVAYKGMMLAGVPNFAFVIGYVNSSWTLRSDLVARYVTRLLRHMRRRGHEICTPVQPDDRERFPLLNLSAGYAIRGASALPKNAGRAPWQMHHNYLRELLFTLRRSAVNDRGVRFSKKADVAVVSESESTQGASV